MMVTFYLLQAPRSIDVLKNQLDTRPSILDSLRPKVFTREPDTLIHSYLSMTSRMHYFGDRVLPPEYLRAMAIFYLAESPLVPDLESDYYLSPVIAPEALLARFPKTYILCGGMAVEFIKFREGPFG